MLPQIQYARSADGLRLAFWAMGEGPPLVVLPNIPFSHCQFEWEIPECRAWYERLMAGHRVVRYYARGFGLSTREFDDFSLEAQVRDLDAVVAKLGLEKFALYASGDMGMAAVAYAAANPGRVTHLILWCSWASRAEVSSTPQTRTLRALVEQDWEVYTETAARVIMGWQHDEVARRFAAFYRECATGETVRKTIPALYSWDVSGLLAEVSCPVLVLHRRSIPTVSIDVAGALAAGFPDARLMLLEGSSPLPWLGDMEEMLDAIDGLFGEESTRLAAPAVGRAGTAPVTILFTDLEGSTALTQRLGDESAQEVLHGHNEIVRRALKEHAGREIKHTGDGIMASFTSASGAVECAIAIQRAVASRNESQPETVLGVRIGLNAGEPIAEAGDYFGTAVQLAARVCERAQPGRILATNVIRELTAGKRFLFSRSEDVALRGFEDPVVLYEVSWSG